jgi:hypothetical protein
MSIPDLATLAYHALLSHLSLGQPSLQFSSTVPSSTSPYSMFSLSSDMLSDMLSDILHDASKRRLLTDEFVRGLCASGVPPANLTLQRRDYDVVESLKRGDKYTDKENSDTHHMIFDALSSLSLDSFNELTFNDVDMNNLLHSAATSSPNLTDLKLSKIHHTLAAGAFKAASSHCPNLEAIHLSNLTVSDGSFLQNISQTAEALHSLTLANVTNINDQNLQSLLKSPSHRLVNLDISDSAASNLTFTQLATAHFTMSYLNLSKTDLTMPQLTRISTNLSPTLTNLNIKGCANIGAGGDLFTLLTATANLPNLETLSCTLYFLTEEFDGKLDDFIYRDDDDANETDTQALETEKHTEGDGGTDVAQDNGGKAGFDDGDNDDFWSCRHCTLINDNSTTRCAACFGKRVSVDEEELQRRAAALEQEQFATTKRKPIYAMVPLPPTSVLKSLAIELKINDEKNRRRLAKLIRAKTDASNNDPFDPASPMRKNSIQKDSSSTAHMAPPLNPRESSRAATNFMYQLAQSLPPSLTSLTVDILDPTIDSAEAAATSGDQSDVAPVAAAAATTTAAPDVSVGASCGSFKITRATAALLVSSSPALSSLTLSGALFTNGAPMQIIMEQLPELESLRITSLNRLFKVGTIPKDLLQSVTNLSNAGKLEYFSDLNVCIRSPAVTSSLSPISSFSISMADAHEVTLSSPSLTRFWIEGCHLTEQLTFHCPSLERVHVANFPSLLFMSFAEDTSHCVTDLRLSGNTSMLPQSIAAFRLPNLTRFEVLKMPGLADLQLGELMNHAHASLTSLRINDCRGCGDVVSWLGISSARPLALVELSKVGALFDNDSLKYLLENAKHLRELTVSGGTGMSGLLCGQHSNGVVGEGVFLGSPALHATASSGSVDPIPFSLSSSLGAGAMNEDSAGEHVGLRSIQRTLHDFVNNANVGQEYGFPPTLSGYQRRLVHEVAEQMDLAHESVKLKNGSKIVRVRRKRRDELLLFNSTAEGGAAVGVPAQAPQSGLTSGLAAQLNGTGQQDFLSATHMGSMWDAPQPLPVAAEDVTPGPFPGILPPPPLPASRNSSVNFNFNDNDDDERELEGGLIEDVDVAEEEDENLFKLDDEEDEIVSSSKKLTRKEKKRQERGSATKRRDYYDDAQEEGESDFDKVLQCFPPPHTDSKVLRRLTAMAHQLPLGENGRPICIKFMEKQCTEAKCKYAHEKSMLKKGKELKKFAPLISFVCENAHGDNLNDEKNSALRSPGKSPDSDSNMERFLGRSPKSPSDFGSYVLGTTPPSDFLVSETPPKVGSGGLLGLGRGDSYGREGGDRDRGDEGDRGANAVALIEMVKSHVPLFCNRLLSLTLDDMSAITAIVIDAPCLSRFQSRRCRSLNVISLNVPNLKVLDVTDCSSLTAIPLAEKSMRGLRVAKLSGCRRLGEDTVGRFIGHCRALRQLHLYGSGASMNPSNARDRRRVKTKKGLEKILAKASGKLCVITTKNENKLSKRRESEIGMLDGLDVLAGFNLSSP